MIPEFPEFKRIEIEDSEAVDSFTKHFPYYSDFNFTSLWCWDISNKREVSVLNNNLVVRFTDYETDAPFLSFIGMHDNHRTVTKLLSYAESVGLPVELKLVPEVGIHDISDTKIGVSLDRDNYDYIYLTSRLSELAGNQYKYKRQDANRFIKSFQDHSFDIYNLNEPGTQDAIRKISSAWRARHNTPDDQSILHEADAIERIFRLASVRDIFVGIVKVDGEPSAFSIEEIENRIFSMGHFWKVAEQTQGEYEFMAQSMARHLQSREVIYWNWEQDLGIQTLRDSKLSYRPSDFLKKFIVTRNSA